MAGASRWLEASSAAGALSRAAEKAIAPAAASATPSTAPVLSRLRMKKTPADRVVELGDSPGAAGGRSGGGSREGSWHPRSFRAALVCRLPGLRAWSGVNTHSYGRRDRTDHRQRSFRADVVHSVADQGWVRARIRPRPAGATCGRDESRTYLGALSVRGMGNMVSGR